MKRYFFEGARVPSYVKLADWNVRAVEQMHESPGYGIFDSRRSTVAPIAFALDVADAALIVDALNDRDALGRLCTSEVKGAKPLEAPKAKLLLGKSEG